MAAFAAVASTSVPAISSAAMVLVDVGNTPTTAPDSVGRTWNNINADGDTAGSPFTLLNTAGADSTYRLSISNPAGVTSQVGFNTNNTNGTTAPTGAAAARNYPGTATQDSGYGNTAVFNTQTVEAVRLTLSNLNPNERYSFDFFASRTGVTDVRETEYRITGGTGGTAATSVFLDAANNTGNITGAAGFAPDANNQIVIDLDPGPNNTNANRFFYLGVLEVNSTDVPEPTCLAVIGLGAVGLLSRRRRA